MKEWKEYKLGELIDSGIANLQTGPFGTMLNASEYSSDGVPVIAVQDIGDNKLVYHKFVFVPNETAERLTRYRVKEFDIIFGRKGAVDRRALIKKSEEGWLQGSDCIRLRFTNEINAKYISYQLGSDSHKDWMFQFATGATMPSLNQEILKLLPIKLPSLPEQTAIATILSSLDDKIDLLHRQNKTLEGLAEVVFRAWFVEKEGEDWQEKSLYDIIELVGGGTPKTEVKEYWDGDIKWISGRDVTPNHKSFITKTEKSITELGLQNSSTKLMPKYSMIITARGTVGKYCLLSEPMAFSQTSYGILPNFKGCFFFTYLMVSHSVEELQAAAYGSVFDTITTNTFKEHKIKLPTEDAIQAFEETVKPYFEKIIANTQQIRTLTQTRDGLLPRLMSGEVRVEI